MVKRVCKLILLCLACIGVVYYSSAQKPYQPALFDSSRLGLKGAEAIEGIYAPDTDNLQQNQAGPTLMRWQELSSGPEYAYRDRPEYVPKARQEEGASWMEKILNGLTRFIDTGTGKNLLWLIFFGILGYIGWRVYSGQAQALFARRDKKHVAEEAPEGDLNIDSLLKNDWEIQMQDALQSGAYREAIRFAYLHLLQLMQDRRLIAYRPEKTNLDYISELNAQPQAAPFINLTRQYERIWYGRILPDEKQMDSFQEQFQLLKRSLAGV